MGQIHTRFIQDSHKILVAKIVYSNPNLHHSKFLQKQKRILFILACSKMHYGLTCIQVKKLAYEFAKANDIKDPASWNNNKMAGADWLASLPENAIKIKVCVNLKILALPDHSVSTKRQ